MNNRILVWFDKYAPYIMLVPAIVAICFVQIYPSLDAIRMSFFDINLLKPDEPFVGLGNYITMFNDPLLIRILLNTLFWTALSLIIGCSFALFVAVQLNKPFWGRGFFRTIFLAPWVTPPLVVATIWQLILSRDFSPISGLLMKAGIISSPIDFLGNPTIYYGFLSIPMISLIVINVWSMFPFSMVMFLAALQTIPNELYEAAIVDGATKWQQFRGITLPMILPVIETTILLQGIWQFNSFNLSYLVTHGGPLNTTELLSVRVYNEAFVNFKYGYAASISVVMLLIVLVPALIYIRNTMAEENSDIV